MMTYSLVSVVVLTTNILIISSERHEMPKLEKHQSSVLKCYEGHSIQKNFFHGITITCDYCDQLLSSKDYSLACLECNFLTCLQCWNNNNRSANSASFAKQTEPLGWSCGACTFWNNENSIECSICRTAKPIKPENLSENQETTATMTWQCHECQSWNSGDSGKLASKAVK